MYLGILVNGWIATAVRMIRMGYRVGVQDGCEKFRLECLRSIVIVLIVSIVLGRVSEVFVLFHQCS